MFEPVLERLSADDIPGLIQLSRAVQWDYSEAEVHTILALGPVFGHKDEHGRLLSCAGVIRYEGGISVIGMVIVDPAFHGRGLGRSLMHICMEQVPPPAPIMLIATEMGRPLYEKLGFRAVDTIHKYICETFTCPSLEAADGVSIEAMRADDLHEVVQLDAQAVGTVREAFLRQRMMQAKTCLVARDASGSLKGYGFAVQTPANLVTGPIVAADHNLAVRIVSSLAKEHAGQLRIDVPNGQFAFLDLLESCGFVKSNQPPVMVARASRMPERNQTYYAIASQFYG
ncbi:GNAT family N-acetyltransferase [Brevibacillus sp. TJ4]|uniref:GNAT family N-acetyltransferase n=1 Tax=Brevibacillus sp. TJ4 TaxID=3234853 RepID=UPI0037D5D2A0